MELESVSLCGTHRERGLLVVATRRVGGFPMCEDCFNGIPVFKEVEMLGCDWADHSGLRGCKLTMSRSARPR